MRFVDQVSVKVRSGDGGAGAVTFRREKFVPKGGPSGGDGGAGGSVLLEADPHLYTLMDLRNNSHYFADDGEGGGSNNRKGKSGDDVVLHVPVGTVAREASSGQIIGDLTDPGEQLVLAQGGRGGRGNAFFKSSTNQAPRHAQPGEPGEEKEVVLELKLLADVGLVGFPNAGKSTLVSTLSAAKPKIADYPFTTLNPQLGVIYLETYRSFVMADIPGIIEGAHEGKGLGLRFLRHIERNAVLLFTIPITSNDPGGEYETLLEELKEYDPALLAKPRLVALTKIDVLAKEEQALLPDILEDRFPEDVDIYPISSVAHTGLNRLKQALWEHVKAAREETQEV